jgi:hypothetical protein
MIDVSPEPPVLDARRSDDGSGLLVWCKYCGRSHMHGRHRLGGYCTYDWTAVYNLPGNECTCPTGTHITRGRSTSPTDAP